MDPSINKWVRERMESGEDDMQPNEKRVYDWENGDPFYWDEYRECE